MSRKAFMDQLAYLLQDISEEELQEALDYYEGYFEEAGESDEEQVAAQLGSPEKVAAEIKAGIHGNFVDDTWQNGEYTECGYEDSRFRENKEVPDAWGTFEKEEKQGKKEQRIRGFHQWWDRQSNIMRLVWLGIFLIILGAIGGIALGAAFGVVGGALGLVIGILGLAIGLVAGIFGVTISSFAGGAELIVAGIAEMFSFPPLGLLYCGLGCLAIAGGVLMIYVCRWFCQDVVIAFARWVIKVIRNIFSGRRYTS